MNAKYPAPTAQSIEQFRLKDIRTLLEHGEDGSWAGYAWTKLLVELGKMEDPGIERWNVLLLKAGRIHALYKRADSKRAPYMLTIDGVDHSLATAEMETACARAMAILEDEFKAVTRCDHRADIKFAEAA